MPSSRPIRFRLLADLPLEVAACGITYRLENVQVPVSGLWQLRASYAGGYWLCAYAASEEKLRRTVYQDGLEPAAEVVRAVFERLAKEGRAEAGTPLTPDRVDYRAPRGE